MLDPGQFDEQIDLPPSSLAHPKPSQSQGVVAKAERRRASGEAAAKTPL